MIYVRKLLYKGTVWVQETPHNDALTDIDYRYNKEKIQIESLSVDLEASLWNDLTERLVAQKDPAKYPTKCN